MYSAAIESEALETIPVDLRCGFVVALTYAFVYANILYLRTHQGTPLLYQSGVVYQNQDIRTAECQCCGRRLGGDRWQDIPRLLETRGGACEDLVAWRVAELRMAGEVNAQVDVDTSVMPDGHILYHVIVVRGNGQREDPSRLLGMP